jgi:hypothetical protein
LLLYFPPNKIDFNFWVTDNIERFDSNLIFCQQNSFSISCFFKYDYDTDRLLLADENKNKRDKLKRERKQQWQRKQEKK